MSNALWLVLMSSGEIIVAVVVFVALWVFFRALTHDI